MGKVKLFIATTYYPQFVSDFYSKNEELRTTNYENQYAKLMQQGFGFGDVWKYELEKTGNFEVTMVIINLQELQQVWAKENDIKFDQNNWIENILNAQIDEFKPDLLFAHDRILLTPEFIRKLKSQHASIKKVISWDGIALCDKTIFAESDVVFTCVQFIADYYKNLGFESFYIPFGFDSRILDYLMPVKKEIDISFVGSLTLRKDGHRKRLELLSYISRKTDANFWLSSFNSDKIYFAKQLIKIIQTGQIQSAIGALELSFKNKGDAFGLEMFEILAQSKITLNSHIDTAITAGGNSRLLEATGVGTCLVTDWKPNMADLFKLDEEIITYKSKEECVEKIKYLINNPNMIEQVAKAGQKRTLEFYSYQQSFSKIIPFLLNLS